MLQRKQSLLLVGLAVLALVLAACDEQAATPAQPTPARTSAPVHVAPAPTKAVQATPTIGMNITDFTGAYGAPTKSDATAGTYTYTVSTGTLDVTVRTKEPGHNLVLAVLFTPKDTSWTAEQAQGQCLALAPHDAKMQKSQTFNSNGSAGTQIIYQSAQLAMLVPKEEFLDGNLNPTAPGTFGVVLSDDAAGQSTIDSCSTQIGLQSV